MSITPGSSYTNPVQTDLTCINQSMAKTKHQMAKNWTYKHLYESVRSMGKWQEKRIVDTFGT